MKKEKTYKVAFVTEQGVPKQLGVNRTDLPVKAVDAMAEYLSKNPVYKTTPFHTFSLV